jgi:NADH dehydrogenase FAD-containing subunit
VTAPATRLVLAGVGHANLEVLRRLSRERLGDLDMTVVSPGTLHHYSGMVPGYLAGTYRLSEIAVHLAPLVRAAGGTLLLGRVVALDPRRRVVQVVEILPTAASQPVEGRRLDIPYDLAAFAVGSDAIGAAAAVATGDGAVLPCKPIGRVVELRRRLEAMAERRQAAEPVVVVGGGAAGVEIALGIAGRFAAAATPHPVILLEAGAEILAGTAERFRRRAAAALARHRVEVRTRSRVVAVEPIDTGDEAGGGAWPARGKDLPADAQEPAARVHPESGAALTCRLVVWVTAAVGWPLFRDAGLPLDERGFLLTNAALRSVADPRVFAAGDCGTLADFRSTPKAGVYAVREGPILYRSLRAAIAAGPPPRYRPQRGFLAILNTADGCALLSYKGLVSYSRWAWRLKDQIDRRFVARYRYR